MTDTSVHSTYRYSTHSDQQRRYFHGPVLSGATVALGRLLRRPIDNDEAKSRLKRWFATFEETDPETGEIRRVTPSFAELSKDEVRILIDKTIAFAATQGVTIEPPP